ncbi:MAG: T9SS type A sorting domain-containing protein [Chitinophagales bacterium]|nr:T9SS type A sorting domain-containing protein [Chitinophagales bacterium]MDW8427285.1 T9SS type A sorting domain-containing protein [Chitinophagales bacterium]
MFFVRALFTTWIALMMLNASGQADLYVEEFSVTYSGDPDWTNVSLKVINNGSMPACCNLEVGIYVGKTALLIPSQLLFYLRVGFFLYANDTVFVDTTFNFCDTTLLNTIPNSYRSSDPLFIGYSIDPHDKVAEVSESNNAGIFAQPFYLSCAVGLDKHPKPDAPYIFFSINNQIRIPVLENIYQWNIRIYNFWGQSLPVAIHRTASELIADVSGIPKGNYLVQLFREDGSAHRVFRITVLN